MDLARRKQADREIGDMENAECVVTALLFSMCAGDCCMVSG